MYEKPANGRPAADRLLNDALPSSSADDAAAWADTVMIAPDGKVRITIRLDRDIVEFFREGGPYQTRINAVLRAYVEHSKAGRRSGR